MKHEIILPIITSASTSLASKMNGQVRMINLMIDQLYAQHEKMEEIKADKKKYPEERERRVRGIAGIKQRYESQVSVVSALEKEGKNISPIEFVKKIRHTKQINDEREKLEAIKQSLLQASHVLNKKDDYYGRIDFEMESVHVPNYKNHLAKLYNAIKEYRQYASAFEKLTGVKAPDIEVDKILLSNEKRGELPLVNIDYIVPTLELELAYDEFDDFEDGNELI